MSSPPRRRHKGAPMEETQGSVRTTRPRLPELDAAPAARFIVYARRITEPKCTAVDNGSRTTSADKGESHICQGALKTRQCLPALDKLPEDMLEHIHSLVPLQDAARAACVSRRFLRSWRCYSNLTLNRITLGETDYSSEGSEMRYINKIEKILNNYSGSGKMVKKLRINLLGCKTLSAPCLDRWLQIAVKPGTNELSLSLPYSMKEKYCFPYSVLFDETTNSSIQSLYLYQCIFQPIETLGCFRKLKSLDFYNVQITEEGLNQLLSKSSDLERLQIYSCSEMLCLKIPCTLQKLKLLTVKNWHKMRVVEISAPNLSTFHYNGFPLKISIRDPSESIARNDESRTLLSRAENVNTAMHLDKLHHLKILEVKLYGSICSPMYDIFSVGSFVYAFPALESFILHAGRNTVIDHFVAGDDAYLMRESAYQHERLKRVKITGFHSAQGLIKLVIHILKIAPSLESLMLDTTHGYGRKPGDTSKCTASGKSYKCCWMNERDLEDAKGAVEAAGRYIVGRVPSAVEFKVLEPCRRCYVGNR